PGAEVAAFAGDGAVLRLGAGVDARQPVRGGPVDGHVVVVPAVGVRIGGRCAGQLRCGQVDVDVLDGRRAAVAGVVLRAAGDALAGALVLEQAAADAPGDPRLRVVAAEANQDRGVVPAVGVGCRGPAGRDRRGDAVDLEGEPVAVGRAVLDVPGVVD